MARLLEKANFAPLIWVNVLVVRYVCITDKIPRRWGRGVTIAEQYAAEIAEDLPFWITPHGIYSFTNSYTNTSDMCQPHTWSITLHPINLALFKIGFGIFEEASQTPTAAMYKNLFPGIEDFPMPYALKELLFVDSRHTRLQYARAGENFGNVGNRLSSIGLQ